MVIVYAKIIYAKPSGLPTNQLTTAITELASRNH
jgi:hypothetical protein